MNAIASKTLLTEVFVLALMCSVCPLFGATLYWVGDGGQNEWNTTTQSWVNANPPPFTANSTYQDGVDGVVFDRDTPGNRTITVQPAGVSPTSFQVDTDGTWNFSGGNINAALVFMDTSGGASTLNFNYSTTFGLTNAIIKRQSVNWVLGGSATAGNYSFVPSGVINLADTGVGGGPTFNFDVSSGAAGLYTLTDDFSCSSVGSLAYLSATLAAGQSVQFGGNITLNADGMYWGGTVGYSRFLTGTLTLNADSVVDISVAGSAVAVYSNALITGDSYTLTLRSGGNSDARQHIAPVTGSNMDLGSLVLHQASLYVNPTNVVEDYFGTLRGNGGVVTVTNNGTSQTYSFGQLWLRNGTYSSGDFRIGPARGDTTEKRNQIIFDTSLASYNPRLSGNFIVSATSGLASVTWRQTASSGGTLTGNMTLGPDGLLCPLRKSTSSGTFTLAGALTLLNGAVLQRRAGERTVRIKLTDLFLGDGNASTVETNSLVGGVVNSGGPNEAFGYNVDPANITDDGNVILRYVGPDSVGNALRKYSIDWRNSSGVVQPFRCGSAGTILEPGTLPSNGGMVLHGGANNPVFTATSPTLLTTPGIVTFSTTLPNHNVDPTPGHVLVTGGDASFDLNATGIVWAASVTVTNGATVSGIGTFDAPVVVRDGTIAPGVTVGTLTMSNVTLSATSVLELQLPEPGVVGSGTNDLLVVNGNLVIDGTVNVTASGGPGTYTIITYSGTLSDNELEVGNIAGGTGTVVAGGGIVQLIISPSGAVIVIR